jgi:hypothetical protein
MKSPLLVAITAVSKENGLSDADRAHLKRWASEDYRDNPIWQKLETAARARSILPMNSFYMDFVKESLYMRGRAESVASGINFDLRHNRRLHQWQLELAKKAEDLADYYKWAEDYSGIAMFFYRFLRPVGELEELHRREAALFRQRTRLPPKPGLRVSRQDRSKGRKGLRKVNAFIDLANEYLKFGFSGKPDHEAIALLSEIAFPNFFVDSEYVRMALRPTTAVGRSEKAIRALAARKS